MFDHIQCLTSTSALGFSEPAWGWGRGQGEAENSARGGARLAAWTQLRQKHREGDGSRATGVIAFVSAVEGEAPAPAEKDVVVQEGDCAARLA